MGVVCCGCGVQVSKGERQESERYYIKRYVHEWLGAVAADKDGQAVKDFLMLHPLYQQHVEGTKQQRLSLMYTVGLLKYMYI